jgi:hypothetical protein
MQPTGWGQQPGQRREHRSQLEPEKGWMTMLLAVCQDGMTGNA